MDNLVCRMMTFYQSTRFKQTIPSTWSKASHDPQVHLPANLNNFPLCRQVKTFMIHSPSWTVIKDLASWLVWTRLEKWGWIQMILIWCVVSGCGVVKEVWILVVCLDAIYAQLASIYATNVFFNEQPCHRWPSDCFKPSVSWHGSSGKRSLPGWRI